MTLERKEFYYYGEFVNEHPEYKEQAEKALLRLFNHGYTMNEEETVIIIVEDYYCIAEIYDEFTPIEIYKEVIPFDAKRIYPLQGIEKEKRGGRRG